MPVKRLPLLQLGDASDFHRYQEVFDQLFLVDDIFDPLGRRVYIPPGMCRHICFVPDKNAPDPALRQVWDQSRAECIEWAYTTLTDPDEIRPDHQNPRNQAYLLEVLPGQIILKYPKYYYLAVRPEPKAGRVVFLTAYPCRHAYWKDARTGNVPIYRRPRR